MDARIRYFDVAASTNDLALAAQEDGAVYWAGAQTSGRGQRGAHWESASSSGLWFSVCVSGPPDGLPFAAVLAVRDALHEVAPLRVKWPNDLLCNGRKICGVLVEHRGGWNAVGIGLNVSQDEDDFPEEISGLATSLKIETSKSFDARPLLESIVEALDRQIALLRAGGYRELRARWAEACDIVGKTIERDGVRGRVADLDHDGALLVETEVCLARIDHGAVRVLEDEATPCCS